MLKVIQARQMQSNYNNNNKCCWHTISYVSINISCAAATETKTTIESTQFATTPSTKKCELKKSPAIVVWTLKHWANHSHSYLQQQQQQIPSLAQINGQPNRQTDRWIYAWMNGWTGLPTMYSPYIQQISIESLPHTLQRDTYYLQLTFQSDNISWSLTLLKPTIDDKHVCSIGVIVSLLELISRTPIW